MKTYKKLENAYQDVLLNKPDGDEYVIRPEIYKTMYFLELHKLPNPGEPGFPEALQKALEEYTEEDALKILDDINATSKYIQEMQGQ